jgi:hypothetical protein
MFHLPFIQNQYFLLCSQHVFSFLLPKFFFFILGLNFTSSLQPIVSFSLQRKNSSSSPQAKIVSLIEMPARTLYHFWILQILPARESLVSDIPAGDGKSLTLFYSAMLLYSMYKDIYFRIVQILSLYKNTSLLFTTFNFFILFLVNFVTSEHYFLKICLFHSFFAYFLCVRKWGGGGRVGAYTYK